MKRKALPIAISLLFGTAYTHAVTINNPGFEDGMDSWTEKDPASISSVEYSGSKALKINGSPGRVHQVVNIERNTNYELSAYVKGSGQIGVNGLNSILFENQHFETDDWRKVSVSFNSGALTTTQIFAKYTNETDSEVRFDDFRLVETGSTPTPTPTPSTPTPSPSGDCNISDLDVRASDDGSNDGHGPDLAVDGDRSDASSRWSSNGEGKWIQFDLGGITNLDRIDTAWYKGDQRTSYFDVLTSTNGNSWTPAVSGGQSQGSTNYGSNDLGDVSARYVRVEGNGNSSSSWNSLLEAKIYGCDDVDSSAPTPTPTPTPPPSTPDEPNIPSIITDGSLYDLEGTNPNPLVEPSTLRFVPLQAKVTTPNGNGWRHEYKIKSSLRQPMSKNYESFSATIKVDMSDGGKTIVAQYHAEDISTLMKLYVADSSESGIGDSNPGDGVFGVYVRMLNKDSGSEIKKALGTIKSGDSFSFEVINDFGEVSVTAFGQRLTTVVEDGGDSYLKFGNYLQAQYPNGNIDCGESGDSDSFDRCFRDIGISESTVTMTNVNYTRR